MLNPQDRDHLLKASDGSTFTIGLQRRRWLVLMAAMHFASMHAYKTAMSKWRQPTSAAPKAMLRGMPTRVCPGLELPAEVIFSDFLYRYSNLTVGSGYPAEQLSGSWKVSTRLRPSPRRGSVSRFSQVADRCDRPLSCPRPELRRCSGGPSGPSTNPASTASVPR